MSEPTHQQLEQALWSRWSPPGRDDVRSPCPCINALTNHSVLPHSSRGITKDMLIDVLTSPSICNFQPSLATFFAKGAFKCAPLASATTVDLDKLSAHGLIEHDVSLSRDDVALGSNAEFSWARWKEMLDVLVDGEEEQLVGAKDAVRARYVRVVLSRESHRAAGRRMEYSWKEAMLGLGETALWLNLLADGERVPLRYVRVFFEEERMPYAEGWRAPDNVASKSTVRRTMLHLVRVHPHKLAEFWLILQGTARGYMAKVARWFRWCCGHRSG